MRLSERNLLSDVAHFLIDQRVGIIKYASELPREPGAPDFFHYYAKACNALAFSGQGNFSNAGGASTNREIAMAKAIGEAVERYCSAIYLKEELPLSTFESAPFPCVHPTEFALYSSAEYSAHNFPFVPFRESTPVRWSRTMDLNTGEERYLPASMVFMPYSFDAERGEVPIGQRISTGLACHGTFEEAAAGAICEVIERDAFSITWQAALSRPKIRLESLSDGNLDLAARFQKVGDSVTLLNLTMDHGVPTVLAALIGGHVEAPALVVSAAASMDPEKAVKKALEELAHTRRLAQQLRKSQRRFVPSHNYANVVTQDDHVHLYTDPANVHLAHFLFASPVQIDFNDIADLSTGDPHQDLRVLVQQVEAVHHRVLVADLTSDDIAWLGIKVVRAVIPGFHPLFMGYRFRALGGSRLWKVPQKLGCDGITLEAGDNAAPHPFP